MPLGPNRGGTGPEIGTSGSRSSMPGGGGFGGGGRGSIPTMAVPGPGQGGARQLGSQMYQVVRLTPDRTEYGPPVFVNVNDEVTIQPIRTNVAPIFIATSGNSDAKFAPRIQMNATDNPITLSVSTLKEIGVYGTTIGDGVVIVHQRRPQ